MDRGVWQATVHEVAELDTTERPSGCGAASPSQGRWDPDSLRPALSLGGQATAGNAALGALFA